MVDKKRTYTTKQIVESIPRLTTRSASFFADQGVIVPEIDPGAGRGKSRIYSEHNLNQFRIASCLSAMGMTINKIRFVIEYIDLNKIIRDYEKAKLHKHDVQLFIKIYLTDEGKMKLNYAVQAGDPAAVTVDEISGFDEIVVINLGRIFAAAGE
jgi:DNA-binding transcriptional MerR regulator